MSLFLAARSFSFVSLLYLLEFILHIVYNPRYVNFVQCMFLSVRFTAISLEDSSGKFSFSTDLKFLTFSFIFHEFLSLSVFICQLYFILCGQLHGFRLNGVFLQVPEHIVLLLYVRHCNLVLFWS